jgi:hypothetical protein
VWVIVLQILDQITGRYLEDGVTETASIKEKAYEWYAETADGGDITALKSALPMEHNSSAIKEIYCRFPSQATTAIGEALRKSMSVASRKTLIQGLGKYGDASAAAVLTAEANSGPELSSRVEAAKWLAYADPKTAATVLVKEFNQFNGDDQSKSALRRIIFIMPILATEQPDADECLFKGLWNRSINFTYDVVGMEGTMFDSDLPKRKDVSTLEKLLVCELTDDRTQGLRYSYGQETYNAEVGDRAAYSLSRILPSKYPYHPGIFRSERRQERYVFLNIWRKSNGLPAMTFLTPSAPHVPKPNVVVRVLITGEKPEFHEMAEIARRMKLKPMTYEDFHALYEFAGKIELPQNHYIRVLASRDAPGQGITLRVDFDQIGFSIEDIVPTPPYATVQLTLNGNDITRPGSSDPVLYDGEQLQECLSSSADEAFDAELDVL